MSVYPVIHRKRLGLAVRVHHLRDKRSKELLFLFSFFEMVKDISTSKVSYCLSDAVKLLVICG